MNWPIGGPEMKMAAPRTTEGRDGPLGFVRVAFVSRSSLATPVSRARAVHESISFGKNGVWGVGEGEGDPERARSAGTGRSRRRRRRVKRARKTLTQAEGKEREREGKREKR